MKRHLQILASIFCDSMRPMKLVMMTTYLVTIFALQLRSDDAGNDMQMLFEIAPVWVWQLVCFYIFVARYVRLFWWVGFSLTRRTTPVMAMAFWSFLFSSAIVAVDFGMALLYIVCALIETWILARAFAENKLGVES
jgi:hypothetical protein